MCVNTTNQSWERPATKADCAIIADHFPGYDYEDLLDVMSEDFARPLTSDIVLMAAMLHSPVDDMGMRTVPFSGIEKGTRNVAKLPVMDQIVEWFENSALGTDMWKNASDWAERQNGTRVHFAMNCNCGLVPTKAYENGQWTAWKQRFNLERAEYFGRTTVVERATNSIENLSMTAEQLMIWHRIRACLEALPVETTLEVANAA